MERLINAMKAHAARMDAGAPQPRWGLVQSVDPSRPAARVLIQPEGVLSGWLPIAQPLAGNGWTLLSLPLPGDMAFCVPSEGSAGDLVIVGFAHNDGASVPRPANSIGSGGVLSSGAVQVAAGEFALLNKGGAVIRANADGSIYIRGNVGIDGTLMVNGDVYDRHGSLDRLRGHYNTHTHTDTHGDTTGAPNPQDPE